MNVSLLHYFLVQGVCQHIEIVRKCLFTEVFLKLKYGEVEGLFFLFEISEIIDFSHILIGNSRTIGEDVTMKRRCVRSSDDVFWPWK